MAQFINRFDINGKSIVSRIHQGVEDGTIGLLATEIADGRRLDHYAQEYYGNSLNYWIIAAASGIRWPLGIGSGKANRGEGQENIVLYIPDLEDIIRLKNI